MELGISVDNFFFNDITCVKFLKHIYETFKSSRKQNLTDQFKT